jgi:hypothetical protein
MIHIPCEDAIRRARLAPNETQPRVEHMRSGGRSLISETEALDRLRKNFYQLYKPFREAQENPSVLEEWRRAPRGSIGWRSLIFYEQALRVLRVSAND